MPPFTTLGSHKSVGQAFLSVASTGDWKVAHTGRQECLPYNNPAGSRGRNSQPLRPCRVFG
jgi:hypothetical protein